MGGRRERDGVSECPADSLARPGCCWTAVFLLSAFPPFLSAIKLFLPLFFHFIILLSRPSPVPKQIYNSCPDLSTLLSSSRLVSITPFSSCTSVLPKTCLFLSLLSSGVITLSIRKAFLNDINVRRCFPYHYIREGGPELQLRL